MTALISISFMVRNTSPVGWIPLLAYKVFKHGSLLPFIKAFFVVSLPIIISMVYIDTRMYKSDEWVLTSYNFLNMNILLGLSKTFGEDDFFYYWLNTFWADFLWMTPCVYAGIALHPWK